MSDALFNIALFPTDAIIHSCFQAFAQDHFKDIADQYLLGPMALPHVTLCQFHAPDADAALEAFAAWNGPQTFTIRLANFRIRNGDNGKFWAEFLVDPDPALYALEKTCRSHLAALGFAAPQATPPYCPHFTMARLPVKPKLIDISDSWLRLPPIETIPQVGDSSETGVFIRVLSR